VDVEAIDTLTAAQARNFNEGSKWIARPSPDSENRYKLATVSCV
jgi:hypothetical protein